LPSSRPSSLEAVVVVDPRRLVVVVALVALRREV
jgi:hypothetical protein